MIRSVQLAQDTWTAAQVRALALGVTIGSVVDAAVRSYLGGSVTVPVTSTSGAQVDASLPGGGVP